MVRERHRQGYPDSPPCLLVRLQLAGRRRSARTCWPRSPPKAGVIGPLSPVRAKNAGRFVFDWPSAAARPGISRGLEGGHLAVGAPLRTCHDLTSEPAGRGIRGCQGSVAEQVRRRLSREGFPALGHATPPVPLGRLVLLRGAGRFHWQSRTVRNHSAAGRCLFPQKSACRRPRTQATRGCRVRSPSPPPADEARAGLAGSGCGARGALAAGGLSAAPSRAGDSSGYSPRCTVGLGRRWGPVVGGPSNTAAITAAVLGAALPDSDACLAG